MTTNNEIISIREFARRVDVNESTVRGHINNDRFTDGVQYDDQRRPKIVWPVALHEWEAFGGGIDKDNKRQPVGKQAPENVDEAGDVPDIKISRARNEYYKAKMAQLECLKAEGVLLAKDAVYKAQFEHASMMRGRLMSIPDLCIDEIMATQTRRDAHSILYNAIEAVLIDISGEGILDAA